jgi:hypothetical protein
MQHYSFWVGILEEKPKDLKAELIGVETQISPFKEKVDLAGLLRWVSFAGKSRQEDRDNRNRDKFSSHFFVSPFPLQFGPSLPIGCS